MRLGYKTLIVSGVGACAMVFTGCGNKSEFTVEGNLKGKTDSPIMLERLDASAGWVVMAETTPNTDGIFAFKADAPQYPELYRLNYNGRYVYLPVDSIEHFTLSANASDISNGFSLKGSAQAEALTEFEKEARLTASYANTDSTTAFKKRVYNSYLKDGRGNILSYYILTYKMGDEFLIDYTDPVYWAVATAFETYKPNDPHTALLAARAKEGQTAVRRNKPGRTQKVIKARQTGMIDITLPGIEGKEVSLSSRLAKGKPLVLVFGGMTIPDAPVINMALRKLYESGAADIYQVCLDQDQYQWVESAKALPWTVVYDPEGLQSSNASRYNLASIPAYFIYDNNGDLINSTGDIKAVSGMLH